MRWNSRINNRILSIVQINELQIYENYRIKDAFMSLIWYVFTFSFISLILLDFDELDLSFIFIRFILTVFPSVILLFLCLINIFIFSLFRYICLYVCFYFVLHCSTFLFFSSYFNPFIFFTVLHRSIGPLLFGSFRPLSVRAVAPLRGSCLR